MIRHHHLTKNASSKLVSRNLFSRNAPSCLVRLPLSSLPNLSPGLNVPLRLLKNKPRRVLSLLQRLSLIPDSNFTHYVSA